jgi:hypothetical protein
MQGLTRVVAPRRVNEGSTLPSLTGGQRLTGRRPQDGPRGNPACSTHVCVYVCACHAYSAGRMGRHACACQTHTYTHTPPHRSAGSGAPVAPSGSCAHQPAPSEPPSGWLAPREADSQGWLVRQAVPAKDPDRTQARHCPALGHRQRRCNRPWRWRRRQRCRKRRPSLPGRHRSPRRRPLRPAPPPPAATASSIHKAPHRN